MMIIIIIIIIIIVIMLYLKYEMIINKSEPVTITVNTESSTNSKFV
jgi:hypothetical protein